MSKEVIKTALERDRRRKLTRKQLKEDLVEMKRKERKGAILRLIVIVCSLGALTVVSLGTIVGLVVLIVWLCGEVLSCSGVL